MTLNRHRLVLGALGILSIFLCIHVFTAASGVCLAMAVVSGVRSNPATTGTPSGAIDSNSRVIDMSDTIHLLDPNEAALTALTMKLRKAHCINPKVEWLEDDYLPTTASASASFTTGTAAIAFATTDIVNFRKGDILQQMTSGELMYVSSADNTTGSATVVRGLGGTATQVTGTTTDVFMVIGNANEEGASSRTVKSTTKTPLFNFTQIFRWPFGLTRTLNRSELYGGSDLSYQTRKAGIEHRISMEKSFLFGLKRDTSTDGSGAAPIRFCDGLEARITTNVTTGTQVTTATLETFLQTGFRYGPARKIFLISRAFASFINNVAVSKIVTVPTDSSFPMAISEYVSPHGKTYLVTHNLLAGSNGTNLKYGGWGFLLDLDSIFYRYLQGSDTMLRTNIQANDVDGRTDEYLTEACPMIIQEKNHSIWKKITGN